MKYAVVLASGKQYRVSEGDTVELDFLDLTPKDSYSFSEVILFVDGDTRKIGTPLVAGVSVSATVVENKLGEKIRVAKFKAKAKYRRVTGHRSKYTVVKIDKISVK